MGVRDGGVGLIQGLSGPDTSPSNTVLVTLSVLGEWKKDREDSTLLSDVLGSIMIHENIQDDKKNFLTKVSEQLKLQRENFQCVV